MTTIRLGLTGPPLDYDEGYALQRSLHDEVVAGAAERHLVLCEHASVYTAGRRTQPSDLPRDGSPVVEVDRGGRITWHGPGQLVAYPVVRLPEPIDVVAYVRLLEQVVIDTCADFGVRAERIDGRSGAWIRRPLGDEKVGAIGIRVANGVTMHGISLNCSNTLDAYASIVACGISDAGVTTLSLATGRAITPGDVVDTLERHLDAYLDTLRPALAGAAVTGAGA